MYDIYLGNDSLHYIFRLLAIQLVKMCVLFVRFIWWFVSLLFCLCGVW
jgi:hypothetical protein